VLYPVIVASWSIIAASEASFLERFVGIRPIPMRT